MKYTKYNKLCLYVYVILRLSLFMYIYKYYIMDMNMISNDNNEGEIYGVVRGCYLTNLDRNLELDNRIYERNIPSVNLQPSINTRPVSTKYDMMSIYDRRGPCNEGIQKYPVYNPEASFNPGTRGPYSGYAVNVNLETELRNQYHALQKNDMMDYIPSSRSDMYEVEVAKSSNTLDNPHMFLEKKFEFDNFNPNTYNLGKNIFMNHTRQQLKEVDM